MMKGIGGQSQKIEAKQNLDSLLKKKWPTKVIALDVDSLISRRLAKFKEQQNDPIKQATKGLVKALITTSLFAEISLAGIPKKFTTPKSKLFDGIQDPLDHILHVRQLMALYESNDFHMC